MKDKTIRAAWIGGICTIIAAVIGLFNINGVTITNDGGTVICGNNNSYSNEEINISNITKEINVSNMSEEDKLNIARSACVEGDFDTAYDIYKEIDTRVSSLNLAYIYANGLSYAGEDIEKAEECLEKANCMEAERYLLVLYIENGMVEEAQNQCVKLLWSLDDNVTWDYITNCLYQQSWNDYQQENCITKDEFSMDFNLMYEWGYTDNYYQGYNPPMDTKKDRWILQGTDFAVNENSNHPYFVYRKQKCAFARGYDNMACLYYEEDGILYPILD